MPFWSCLSAVRRASPTSVRFSLTCCAAAGVPRAHRGGRAALRVLRRSGADHRDHQRQAGGLRGGPPTRGGADCRSMSGMRNWHPLHRGHASRDGTTPASAGQSGSCSRHSIPIRAASSISENALDARVSSLRARAAGRRRDLSSRAGSRHPAVHRGECRDMCARPSGGCDGRARPRAGSCSPRTAFRRRWPRRRGTGRSSSSRLAAWPKRPDPPSGRLVYQSRSGRPEDRGWPRHRRLSARGSAGRA